MIITVKRITFVASIRFQGTEHTWLDKSHTSSKRVDIFWNPKETLFYIVDPDTKSYTCVLYANVRYFEVEGKFDDLSDAKKVESTTIKRSPGRPAKETTTPSSQLSS